jgi:hypothetical protein
MSDLKPYVFSWDPTTGSILWEAPIYDDQKRYRCSDESIEETIETLQDLLQKRAVYQTKLNERKRQDAVTEILKMAEPLFDDVEDLVSELMQRSDEQESGHTPDPPDPSADGDDYGWALGSPRYSPLSKLIDLE